MYIRGDSQHNPQHTPLIIMSGWSVLTSKELKGDLSPMPYAREVVTRHESISRIKLYYYKRSSSPILQVVL
jgi:hypothetical protein